MPNTPPTPFQQALIDALNGRDPNSVSADDLLAAAEAKLQRDLGMMRKTYSGKMAKVLLDDFGVKTA